MTRRLLLIAVVTNPLTWAAAAVAALALSLLAVAALGALAAWCWWTWTVGSGRACSPSLTLGVPPGAGGEVPRVGTYSPGSTPAAAVDEVVTAAEPPAPVADGSESAAVVAIATAEPAAAAAARPARKPAKTMTMMERRGQVPPPARKPGRATLRAEAKRLGVPGVTRGMRAESIARRIAAFRAA